MWTSHSTDQCYLNAVRVSDVVKRLAVLLLKCYLSTTKISLEGPSSAGGPSHPTVLSCWTHSLVMRGFSPLLLLLPHPLLLLNCQQQPPFKKNILFKNKWDPQLKSNGGWFSRIAISQTGGRGRHNGGVGEGVGQSGGGKTRLLNLEQLKIWRHGSWSICLIRLLTTGESVYSVPVGPCGAIQAQADNAVRDANGFCYLDVYY